MTSYADFLAAKLPARVRGVIARCFAGETLCRTIIHTSDGNHIEEYHFEPSNDHAPLVSSQKAIKTKWLVGNGDDLLGDGNEQTWRATK